MSAAIHPSNRDRELSGHHIPLPSARVLYDAVAARLTHLDSRRRLLVTHVAVGVLISLGALVSLIK